MNDDATFVFPARNDDERGTTTMNAHHLFRPKCFYREDPSIGSSSCAFAEPEGGGGVAASDSPSAAPNPQSPFALPSSPLSAPNPASPASSPTSPSPPFHQLNHESLQVIFWIISKSTHFLSGTHLKRAADSGGCFHMQMRLLALVRLGL